MQSLVARRHRRVTRDTWVLIDQKLGAFVRVEILLITLVAALLVLVSVTTVGILLGGLWILLAIPIASVVATLVDVIVRDVDPADVDAPALLFAAKDSDG